MLAALSYAEKLIECFDFEEQTWSVITEKPGGHPVQCCGSSFSKYIDPYVDPWKKYGYAFNWC